MFKKIAFLFTLILFTTAIQAGSTIHHKLSVKVDPAKHSFEAVDQITNPAAQTKSNMDFLLNGDFNISSETPGVTVKLSQEGIKAEYFGMDREDFHLASEFKQNKYSITFSNEIKGDQTFTLKFSGVINYSIKQIGEEYARGFSQTPGIIDEKGIYLGGSTYWIPWFNKEWINFELTATVPQPWDIVSQGKRTLNETKDGNHIIRWDSPEPMEEIYLIGAQFKEYSLSAGA